MNKTAAAQPFQAACLQFNPIHKERDRNIAALMREIERAAEHGAKLIVTPEMATTGYHYPSREAIAPFVDTIPGYTTEQLSQVCKRYGVYVVVGMPEVDEQTELFYNAAVLLGPTGYIGKYRKVHLWETEEHWAAWGDLGVPVFATELGNIAINICMDSIFFESARLAALQGANILAFPTNSTAQSVFMLQARAEANGLYIVSANRSNTEQGYHMIGASAVWSPTGEKLVESDFLPTEQEDVEEPTIVYAWIDPSRYQNAAQARLAERKPKQYKELMLYKAPWDYRKTLEPRQLSLAVLQYQPTSGNKQANLATIERLVRAAAESAQSEGNALSLIVLPELATTGPLSGLSREECYELSETSSGNVVEMMGQLAREHQVSIVFGLAERADATMYNSALLLNPGGDVEGVYRQVHVHPADRHWACAGDKISVFSSPALGRTGLLLGYDALFPEATGVLAVGRADLLAIPSGGSELPVAPIAINPQVSAHPYPPGTSCLYATIAISAQAYTAVASFVQPGERHGASSGIYTIDPLYGLDHTRICAADREEVLLSTITTLQNDWWFHQEKLITARRTQTYRRLVCERLD